MLLTALLGLLAGAVTTHAGLGGGLVLTLALAALHDPMTSLAIAGVGLLVGNLHRSWMYRSRIVVKTAVPYVLGAVPGALIGGLVAAVAPERLVRGSMLVAAALATAKVLFAMRWTVPPGAMLPGGAAVGFVSATSGGGGLLAGPLLLGTGLTGRTYVATGSVGAASVHVARLAGYGAGGAVDSGVLASGALLALTIPLGNLAGERLRRITPPAWTPRVEVGVVVAALLLATAGFR
jgi:hypothetical protein